MARFLRHRFNVARIERSGFGSCQKWLSSDALAEIGVDAGEVGLISGIPEEQLRRRVVIYSPSRTATQQGSGKVGKWKIDFLSTQKWENPLMGWTSKGDPYAYVGEAALSFDTEEAAKTFCEKYGWNYVSGVTAEMAMILGNRKSIPQSHPMTSYFIIRHKS